MRIIEPRLPQSETDRNVLASGSATDPQQDPIVPGTSGTFSAQPKFILADLIVIAPPSRKDSVRTRILRRIAPDENGCWLWLGNRNRWGYGILAVGGRQRFTHRLLYEALIGPIPDGLQIDHLCRNPPCCNPEHIEPVTGIENRFRSPKYNGNKTHCPSGHEYANDNLYTYPAGRRRSGRRCRTCLRIQKRVAYKVDHGLPIKRREKKPA